MNLLNLAQAQALIANGQILAYPTEGVWGLGCDPLCTCAVEQILAIKQREAAKGLILVAAHLDQLSPWLYALSAAQKQRLQAPQPRPTTWVIPDPEHRAPASIRGGHASLAIRLSQHPQVQALCQLCGPLVSTSANPAGLAAALSVQEVYAYFGEQVPILAGDLGQAQQASRILDLVSGRILRA
ncbi:L-threonylcarbamoyladenylate synthase [Allopseudospirillum japonicum]|uniref:Threonylcarbamoyl-AMP synthase n=1 Tax=Allopseudospirillum japonicum TaxID=64971 RepID=A0A1H6TUI2_9GAMM|nr:Sua5/YciO/YrdC/YwlC family protein [Allopseudospirillum japonicum]SEI79392.1 L-threonylcarbamoyladenylate synthase [Allopseudospirillum japonicum]